MLLTLDQLYSDSLTMRAVRLLIAALVVLAIQIPAAFSQDISTLLMNSTFEIAGPDAMPGKQTFGTVFLLGKPMKEDPKRAYFVLVTAAHVLDAISGDVATVLLRHKDENGNYTLLPTQIEVRHNGASLYVKNPDADVAAMYIRIPEAAAFDLLSIALLADDNRLNRAGVHPGDELQCLGFPLAINLNGFPVIRSGLLASYPITPTKVVRQLYYNFHTFPGNSGGPVYFSFLSRIVQRFDASWRHSTRHHRIGITAGVVKAAGVRERTAGHFPDCTKRIYYRHYQSSAGSTCSIGGWTYPGFMEC